MGSSRRISDREPVPGRINSRFWSLRNFPYFSAFHSVDMKEGRTVKGGNTNWIPIALDSATAESIPTTLCGQPVSIMGFGSRDRRNFSHGSLIKHLVSLVLSGCFNILLFLSAFLRLVVWTFALLVPLTMVVLPEVSAVIYLTSSPYSTRRPYCVSRRSATGWCASLRNEQGSGY